MTRSCADCQSDLGPDAHPNRLRCQDCARKFRNQQSYASAKRRNAYTKTVDLRADAGCELCGRDICKDVVGCVNAASKRLIAIRPLWDWRDQTGPGARALRDVEAGVV